MRKILSILLFLLASNFVAAQGTLKGMIVDTATGNPLGLATITVFEAGDTTLITYRLSTPDGNFRIPGLPLAKDLRAVISFSGYDVFRHEFRLTDDNKEYVLDTIYMKPIAQSLDEILVIAERPPVTVRKDTIEFNASSFKTLPTALVEDLLKKLPGVQLDSDGNITVNGRRVNRILVDGKEFFGNDPRMATRNLPANIIDKIQVTEDRDEADMNPDKPISDIGQVINLKLKKGVNKGWFGKAYAGGGTDERYEAGSIINMFRDTLQVSLLGFSNNLNRAGFGFQDIRSLGGFDRSGINMMWINSSGGIAVNGISFGGMGEGINTSTGAGFNMNHVLKNGFTLNSQYFYGQTRNDISEFSNRDQYFGDTILNTKTSREEVQRGYSHRIGLSLRGKLDTLNSRLEFNPGLNFIRQDNDKLTTYTNQNNYDGLLNNSVNRQMVNGNETGYDHSLLFFKNFKRKGRTLNISNNFSYKESGNDQINDVTNTFYNGSTIITELDQLRDRWLKNISSNINAQFNEPVSKSLSLRLGYSFFLSKNEDLLNTFTKDAGDKYTVPDPTLSNGISQKNSRHAPQAGLSWKHKQLTITAMANYTMQDITNSFSNNTDLKQRYRKILPELTIRWKEYYFGYRATLAPPSVTDLQPVPDNSNPLYLQLGNPDLEAGVNHSLNLNIFKNITAKMLFLNVYLHGNIRENSVARERIINSDGSQVTMPVNVDGVYDFYTNFHINKQYKLRNNLQFNGGVGYNINYNRNYLSVNGIVDYMKLFSFGPSANVGMNWNDIIEWNINHYRNINNASYEKGMYDELKILTHTTSSELVIRWPKNIVWETSVRYSYNSNAAPGIRKTITLLNGGVTFLFLKDQKGQLKLSGYDLLDQNITVWRSASENGVVERQMNALKRYFMLTFTYNIRNFKGGKVGGRERFFFF